MKAMWQKNRVIILLVAAIAILLTVGIVRGIRNNPFAGVKDSGSPAFTVQKSYTIAQAADGSYSVSVKDAQGNTLFSRKGLTTKPAAETLSDDTVCVVGTGGDGIMRRWGLICDVTACRASEAFGGFLTAKGDNVAYLANLTGGWHVFVRNAYDESAYLQVTTLEGAVADENSEVIKSFEMDKENGKLTVVYFTEGNTTKTITITLP